MSNSFVVAAMIIGSHDSRAPDLIFLFSIAKFSFIPPPTIRFHPFKASNKFFQRTVHLVWQFMFCLFSLRSWELSLIAITTFNIHNKIYFGFKMQRRWKMQLRTVGGRAISVLLKWEEDTKDFLNMFY